VRAFLQPADRGATGPICGSTATYLKVRQNGREGPISIPKISRRPSPLTTNRNDHEAETLWTEFLRKLARRGLPGVKLVISDAHEGIKSHVAFRFAPSVCRHSRADRSRPLPSIAVTTRQLHHSMGHDLDVRTM
jgi:Transposase, Mutator family